MFNMVCKRFNDTVTEVRIFTDHVFTREKPKKGKSSMVPTPFYDDDGNQLYASPLPSESEIQYKKSESIRCSVSRTKSKIHDIAFSCDRWKYFVTFTFSSKFINRYDYDDCAKHMSSFLQKIRAKHKDLSYLIVPELHKDGAFHFHGLFTSELDVTYVGKFKKTGETYHVNGFDFGWNTALEVRDQSRVANYICKYISKDIITVSPHRRRYWYSINTINVTKSEKFLISQDNIDKFIKKYKDKVFYGGKCDVEGKIFLSYYDLYIDSEIYDDIFEFVSGYDDGEFYDFRI